MIREKDDGSNFKEKGRQICLVLGRQRYFTQFLLFRTICHCYYFKIGLSLARWIVFDNSVANLFTPVTRQD